MRRGPIVEINLDSISHNLKVVRQLTSNLPIIAIVKADAYGHGDIEVSRRLVADGVEYLAVAFTAEAERLRSADINVPILVLFDPDTKDIFKYNLTPVISNIKVAKALSKEAERKNRVLNVHIKLDTGMGRFGFTGDNIINDILEIANLKAIRIEGILSHFSDADKPDSTFAKIQIKKFQDIKKKLNDRGLKVKIYHMANSAAIATLPESYFDAIRPGLILYGYTSLKKKTIDLNLKPVMSVKTNLLEIRRLPANTPISYGITFITRRDSLIGIIPVGYADGFCRRLSNIGEVIVNGNLVPIVGRVCMDVAMIDLTTAERVREGDEVILMGRQGNKSIDASTLSLKADTIPYEILTSMGSKGKRVYI